MLTRALAQDIAERATATYVQTFIGLLIVGWTDTIDLAVIQTAAVAAVPAALSVIKGYAASLTGDPDSAAVQR